MNTPTMNEVYSTLNDAKNLMGGMEMTLSMVYKLLNECNLIIKGMIVPEPEPEPVKPLPKPVLTPIVSFTVDTKKLTPKKPNQWITFLKQYAKDNNLTYTQALQDKTIKSKYEDYKLEQRDIMTEQLRKKSEEHYKLIPVENPVVPVETPVKKMTFLEEIRNFPVKPRTPTYIFAFVLLELKEKMKTHVPKGYIYKKVYIRKSYNTYIYPLPKEDDVKEIKDLEEKYNEANDKRNKIASEIWKNRPLIYSDEDRLKMDNLRNQEREASKEKQICYNKWIIKKGALRVYYNGNDEGLANECRVWNSQIGYKKLDKSYYSDIQEDFNIPFIKKYEQFNYEESYIGKYSIINLKSWDKKTKKTTNKGLTATYLYVAVDKDDKCSWFFEGFKVGMLEKICKINGYNKKEGDQYGDLAQWYIKL